MRAFLVYAAVLALGYAGLVAYVLAGGRFGYSIDDADKGVLYTMLGLGFPVVLGTILCGGAVILLWRRFVAGDATISSALWICALVFFCAFVGSALRLVALAARSRP